MMQITKVETKTTAITTTMPRITTTLFKKLDNKNEITTKAKCNQNSNGNF